MSSHPEDYPEIGEDIYLSYRAGNEIGRKETNGKVAKQIGSWMLREIVEHKKATVFGITCTAAGVIAGSVMACRRQPRTV